jgi:hypothetical protein
MMTVPLYYTVVRHVPDPARAEAINIGVVLVGPENFVSVRIASDAGRVKKLDPDYDERFLEGMRQQWPQWLQNELATSGGTPQAFLAEVRMHVGIWQTQLTEPRLVELDGESQDRYKFEQISLDLYERLVKAAPVTGKPPKKRRPSLRKQLKAEFHQLKLLGDVIHQQRWVEGTLPYPVAFLYENGRKIAIDTIEPAEGVEDAHHIGQAAISTFGKWVNVNEHGKEENTLLVSILPSGDSEALRQARALLSEHSIVYQYPTEWPLLLKEITRTLPDDKKFAAGLDPGGNGNGLG